MRTIISLKVLDNYKLECLFEDGTIKIADMSPYLNMEVFKPLADSNAFSTVNNKGNFVEWESYEVDVSADTLWHIGEEIIPGRR